MADGRVMVYEDTRPIFSARLNTIADAYILAYAHKASVIGPEVTGSSKNGVFIREDHPSDNHAWPNALPWKKYAEDNNFYFCSNPAEDGLRKC